MQFLTQSKNVIGMKCKSALINRQTDRCTLYRQMDAYCIDRWMDRWMDRQMHRSDRTRINIFAVNRKHDTRERAKIDRQRSERVDIIG